MLNTFVSLLLNVFGAVKCRRHVLELNSWVKICARYGLDMEKELKVLRKRKGLSYLYLSATAIAMSYPIFLNNGNVDLVLNIFASFATLTQVAGLVYVNTQLKFFIAIYGSARRAFQTKLKDNRGSLEIRKECKFHTAVFRNVGSLADLISPFFLLWILILIVQLIVSIFANALACFIDYHNGDLVILHIRVFCTICSLIHHLVNIEKLANVSDDLLSFLFKYPISKLRADEAAQVEMLIYTLKIQKPVLKASDIFIVGTRLLAPICGTVVTYVLVALQFHKTWSK
ncbi:uncharacterized protein LOC116176746 [Photinus pyralis]|nr:uncharacterized protein LOC116176746 [Photinus pyralis]